MLWVVGPSSAPTTSNCYQILACWQVATAEDSLDLSDQKLKWVGGKDYLMSADIASACEAIAGAEMRWDMLLSLMHHDSIYAFPLSPSPYLFAWPFAWIASDLPLLPSACRVPSNWLALTKLTSLVRDLARDHLCILLVIAYICLCYLAIASSAYVLWVVEPSSAPTISNCYQISARWQIATAEDSPNSQTDSSSRPRMMRWIVGIVWMFLGCIPSVLGCIACRRRTSIFLAVEYRCC